jgi:myo-inositol-1(or 4)-monophosphatase
MNHLDVAIAAAKAAGKIHKKYFRGNPRTKTKSSSFDLVTVADIEAEAEIVRFIRSYFPEHNFLGEEQTYQKTGSRFTWVIDPLDGTNNFATGIPIFCVSIALMFRNKILLGVIYDVNRNELFIARKGKGAYLNNKRISVNTVKDIREAMLITGFYYDRGKEMRKTLRTCLRFLFRL